MGLSKKRSGIINKEECLVEILKLMLNRYYELYEFDPDLCKNLKYELNPRVRCAPGNVLN